MKRLTWAAAGVSLVVVLGGPSAARADGIPGFRLVAVDAVDADLTLSDRLGTSAADADHLINVEDCKAYKGKQIDITIEVDDSSGPFTYTVAVAAPSASCSTDTLTPTNSGCTILNKGGAGAATLDTQTTSERVDLDALLFAADTDTCGGDTDRVATLYFIAAPEAVPTTIYASDLQFRVDLQPPLPPTLESLTVGDGRLAASWSDADNEGDDVTYTLYWREGELTDGNKEGGKKAAGKTAKTYDITSGVTNGVTYSVGVTALDEADNESNLSNTLEGAPTPSTDFWEGYQAAGGTDTGGFCFVATAAYGTSMEGNLNTLRAFRDEVMLQTSWGRAFVDAYYRWGRFPAAYIADKPALRFAVRVALVPLVWVAAATTTLGTTGALALLLTLGMVGAALRRRWLDFAGATDLSEVLR